jgi:hypothetical protein
LPASDGAYDSAVEAITDTLPLYDGRHSVEVRAINSVGAASALIKQTVEVAGVGAQPAYRVDAPKLSNSATVTLTLEAPPGSETQVSEDPFFGAAAWAPTTPHTTMRLGQVEGRHTVYVRFRDKNGLQSPSFPRAVTLDRTAPTGRVFLHSGAAAWLEIQAADEGSGLAGIQISDGATQGMWQPFQATFPAPQDATSIWVRLRDAAGNVSAPIAAQRSGLVYLPFVARP